MKQKLFSQIIDDDSGGATLEIVIITAVLIAIALLFNDSLRSYAKKIFDAVFTDQVLDKIQY